MAITNIEIRITDTPEFKKLMQEADEALSFVTQSRLNIMAERDAYRVVLEELRQAFLVQGNLITPTLAAIKVLEDYT